MKCMLIGWSRCGAPHLQCCLWTGLASDELSTRASQNREERREMLAEHLEVSTCAVGLGGWREAISHKTSHLPASPVLLTHTWDSNLQISVNAGWGKSRVTVMSTWSTEFILVFLFINYCTVFYMNNYKPTFAPPVCSHKIQPNYSTMYCWSYNGPFMVDERLGLGLTEEPGTEDREEENAQTWEQALEKCSVCRLARGILAF